MKSHLSVTLSIMYIGDESGCHEVPEPICPRFITLPVFSDPILTPIAPFSAITSKAPESSGLTGISIVGFWLDGEGEAEGLAEGAGWCVCVCGDAVGDGVGLAAGIFVPGICLSCATA